ncbi:MAG TPA: response regulator [Ktedonobacteraceae bacterium]|nr:response regulator [Ktedonobacteraceae bacterium]
MADESLQSDNAQYGTPSTKIIAIVEDDSDLVDLFRDTFAEYAHWQLTFFSDGELASHIIPDLQPHLILLDVGLPNLDGATLYKILRGHSNTRHTPIIVITGSHDWQLHRMGLQTGLFFRKPFKLYDLLFIMRAHLGEAPPDPISSATSIASDIIQRYLP